MGAFGIGSVCGALAYSKFSTTARDYSANGSGAITLLALAAVAIAPHYAVVIAAW